MKITIRTLVGVTLSLEVNTNDSVRKVKELVQSRQDEPAFKAWLVQEGYGSAASTSALDPSQQRLIFYGQVMEDGKTLGDYNLVDGMVVQLVLRLPPTDICISVKSLDGKVNFKLVTPKTTSVSKLKNDIGAKVDVPSERVSPDKAYSRLGNFFYSNCEHLANIQQKLIYDNKQLDEDDRTLNDYNILSHTSVRFLVDKSN